ncbi:MAG: carboxypeptidase-like regulatory domain-containing protein, partial [Bacteroidota bacterium]|nr:carboxypeptidase-like regulatory domain-containing protein [Bacteroidota bacterium]
MDQTTKSFFFILTLHSSLTVYLKHAFVLLWVTAFITIFCNEAIGQSTIRGNIRDTAGKGLAYVSTGLLAAEGSKLVKGTLTNEEGAYVFTGVPTGKYVVTANMVGYA